MITAASILAGGLTAWLLFRPFFEGLEGLLECVKYWFTPDIISMFRGEWADDQWASTKLFLYLGLSIGSGILTNVSLHKWFG